MHVYQPAVYVPRKWRKTANRGGPKDPGKQRAFKGAKNWSNRFIHLKASQLAKPKIAAQYAVWEEAARKGSLRKTVSGKAS